MTRQASTLRAITFPLQYLRTLNPSWRFGGRKYLGLCYLWWLLKMTTVCLPNSFISFTDAVALANDSVYGLAGAVFSKDQERCQKLSRRLQCGIVWINCSQPTFVQLPWGVWRHLLYWDLGGHKRSGTGRELGPWGLMNYLEPKQVCSWVDTDSKGWDWFAPSKI